MRKYIYFLLFAVILAAAGCQKAAETTPTASPNAKRYPFKGKVVSVNREKRTAEIDHEEIPGYMEAMTMSFPIHQDWVWDELKPGAEVTAELVVDNSAKDPYWLENIGIIAAPDPNAPAPPVNENFVQIGQVPPDFKLIDQDGKPLSLSDYRGKALAITFIYSECPLPDYCIKMSRNFSDLANQVAADPQLSSKIRLLSISFDPERDTPEKLRSYRVGYLGKGSKGDSIWQLAVGTDAQVRSIADFFGLRYETDPNDKTQILHSLRTAVIAPDGKVTKIFTDNDWTPADLLRELKKAAGE